MFIKVNVLIVNRIDIEDIGYPMFAGIPLLGCLKYFPKRSSF